MTQATTRFALPLIVPGQAQKEWFHNEALALLDAALHPCVEEGPTDTPPDAAQLGQGWIVGAAPSGAWVQHPHHLAVQTAAGWRFVAPVSGMEVWSKQAGHPLHWSGVAWSGTLHAAGIAIGGEQVLGSRRPAVPSPSGGTTIDAEARAAIAALIATFQQHGLTE